VLSAACQVNRSRSIILSEPGNFPNDLYVAQGFQEQSAGRNSLRLVEADQIADSIDEQVAVVLLTHVHYKTAATHDMARLTARAHERGALVIWDLCHSAGAVDVDLNGAKVDFAVGCGYKYLNGGPGAPAYVYVAKRHQQRVNSPITGWLGHARAFDFSDQYRPAEGIRRFLAGAHPILGIAALEVGVDLMLKAGMRRVVEKSQRLCSLFIELVESRCGGFGIELGVPRDSATRGSHVSLRHKNGYAIVQALIAQGVIGDFRAPDIMRFGFTPLYISYRDVWNAVEALREILVSGSWDRPEHHQRHRVT
jgi:kynureninase